MMEFQAPTDAGAFRHYEIGVISDTHGYLNPRVLELFRRVDAVIHAGDIDREAVLAELRTAAPVFAVRGNMDRGAWAKPLPETRLLEIGGVCLYTLHDIAQLDLVPKAAGIDIVISGHTHCASEDRKDGVLHLNPGSASLPRGGAAPSVALLDIRNRCCRSRFVALED